MISQPRIAHLIASHHKPMQLRRLISVIRQETPHALIVVHHDRFASPTPYRELTNLGHIEIIEAIAPLRWGDYSMVRLVLDSIAELERRGVRYDWLNFLSAQDYPILPLTAFEEFLAASQLDAYLDAKPWDVWMPDENAERYFFQWHRLGDIPLHHRLRAAMNRTRSHRLVYARVGSWYGHEAKKLPFEKERCYRASMWWTISRRAVEKIMFWRETRSDFFEHYRRTLFPDESCLQTLLLNEAHLRCRTDNHLRFVSWPGTAEATSPAPLKLEDLSRLQESGAYFARKFDFDVDQAIANALDDWRRGVPSR